MTSYFKQCLEHLLQNYLFTHKIYAHDLTLPARLFCALKDAIANLVNKFTASGYPLAELTYYSQIYKNKINRFYFSQISPTIG